MDRKSEIMLSFIKEFVSFIIERKKYVLIPILFFIIIFGVVIVGTQGSAIGPFIYAVF